MILPFLIASLLHITPITSQSIVRCDRFEEHFYNYYSCVVSESNVTTEDSTITFITGNHEAGKTDNDVEEITNIDNVQSCDNCEFRYLTHGILSKFPKLRKIWLSYVKMDGIASNAFETCDELRELNLDANNLKTITNGTFDKCDKLTHLSFEDNQFESIDAGMLRGLVNLERIELQGNKITKLSGFESFKQLKRVNLIMNPLSALDVKSTFMENTKIEELLLMRCELTRLEQATFLTLLELKIIFLDINSLASLPPHAFKNQNKIEHIFLHGNKIKTLDTSSFGQHANLSTIYINNNNLNEIEPNFFENMPAIKYFISRGNLCIRDHVYNMDRYGYSFAEFEKCFDNWEAQQNGGKIIKSVNFLMFSIITIFIKILY